MLIVGLTSWLLINFFFISENIFSVDIESPEGVAIDWISRRLYWTDSKKDTIEVAALDDPKNRAVIIKRDLVNPRGLAVDPHSRYIHLPACSRYCSIHIHHFLSF